MHLKAPVSFRARRIIHVPAAFILIADMIGFQPLLPECGVLRINEMTVRDRKSVGRERVCIQV